MKFGRKPREFDPRIPQLSRLKRSIAPPVLPPAIDYGAALPASLGMFANDRLGDCVEAACMHCLQVWSGNANPPIDTEPDNNAVLLYERAVGYNPSDPSTDQGSVEQTVLQYWLNTGIPTGADGSGRQQLIAFVEIDQLNLENIKTAIFEGGLVFIGFGVPASFNFAPVWTYDPSADNTITDGHAVVLTGYNDASQLFTLISWGAKYQMSYDFFSHFTDEAYLLADKDFIESTGKTPAGLSLANLQSTMQALNIGVSPTMSTITVTVQKTQKDLPAGVTYASTSVVVTDASGATLPAVSLNGTETPAWTATVTGAAGTNPVKAVITDLDTSGAAIGTPITVTELQFPASVAATLTVS